MVAEAQGSVADELGADPASRRGAMVHADPLMANPGTRNLSTYSDPQIRRAPNSAGLYDVLDLILDKGIVIDAFVRVSLVGIELLTVDLRVVIASVDTYLRYAQGVEQLQVHNRSRAARLPDVVGGGAKQSAIKQGARSLGRAMNGQDDDDEGREQEEHGEENEGVGGKLADGVRHVLTRGVGRIMERLSGEEDEGGEESEQKQEPRGNARGRHNDDDDNRGRGSRHPERRSARSGGAKR